jgi:hypothetical protein
VLISWSYDDIHLLVDFQLLFCVYFHFLCTLNKFIFTHFKMLSVYYRYSFLRITALCIQNLSIFQKYHMLTFINFIDYLKLHTPICIIYCINHHTSSSTNKYKGYSESNLCLFEATNVGAGESSCMWGSLM